MISRSFSFSPQGIEAVPISVETDVGRGLPKFTVVGLPDAAVSEARDRVRSALKNAQFDFPLQRITVSLAPADVRKGGSGFDLPIALGILAATGEIDNLPEDTAFFGELGLDGTLRRLPGVLPVALSAKEAGFKRLIVPEEAATEAALAGEGIDILSAKGLREVVEYLAGGAELPRAAEPPEMPDPDAADLPDFADVRGQHHVKRALEIAAAGGHNVLMNGAPGAGKTLMARAMRGLLPPLSRPEGVELARILSVAGELPADRPLPRLRPFRVVHHTASAPSIVGGGTRVRPGEISLAHRGVLFLDELPEFPSSVLEVLRQPLEDRKITVNRASGSAVFPADFLLVAAMNPCPCGYHEVPDATRACTCSPATVAKYQRRISGPLLDRFDLHVDVSPVQFDRLAQKDHTAETTTHIAQRVQQARTVQQDRFAGTRRLLNAEMGVKEIDECCQIPPEAQELLRRAVVSFGLSARAFHRILKVSRTIADLAGSPQIQTSFVAEAIQYRPKVGVV